MTEESDSKPNSQLEDKYATFKSSVTRVFVHI